MRATIESQLQEKELVLRKEALTQICGLWKGHGYENEKNKHHDFYIFDRIFVWI